MTVISSITSSAAFHSLVASRTNYSHAASTYPLQFATVLTHVSLLRNSKIPSDPRIKNLSSCVNLCS